MILPAYENPEDLVAFVQTVREMQEEGYHSLTSTEVVLYNHLGSDKFAEIDYAAYRYASMHARIKKINQNSERFKNLHLDYREQIVEFAAKVIEERGCTPGDFEFPEIDEDDIFKDCMQQLGTLDDKV